MLFIALLYFLLHMIIVAVHYFHVDYSNTMLYLFL